MADDEREPAAGDEPGRRPGPPDETRADRSPDEPAAPPTGDEPAPTGDEPARSATGDETAALPPAGEAAPADQTAALPPVDETAPADQTAALPPVDETAALPPADRTAPLPPPTSWSGRAEVPPPRPAGAPPERWDTPPADEGGRWWMPIVIGIVALLLLGVLGYGVWLISQSGDGTPGEQPTPTATARPTTRPPTTPPTRTEEPTEPAEVEVPPLAGEPLDDAIAELEELDLRYRVRYEVTDEQEPGTVIYTEPEAGTSVAPGSRITLYVAAEPEPEPEQPPTATGSPEAAD